MLRRSEVLLRHAVTLASVDLRKKQAPWEDYYNFLRPRAFHAGKTPYEKLKSKMLN